MRGRFTWGMERKIPVYEGLSGTTQRTLPLTGAPDPLRTAGDPPISPRPRGAFGAPAIPLHSGRTYRRSEPEDAGGVTDKRVTGVCYSAQMDTAIVFDENYLRALRDRDTAAEDYLVTRFFQPVKIKLRARLRSPELVQDACQETFLRVLAYFRSGKTLNNPASLPGFIHTVSHNVALELLRSHTRQDQIPENAPETPDSSVSAEVQLVTDERKEMVRRVISELAPRDRELLRRVFLEDEDKDVVCQEMHVDRGYLRVLLHRARLRLKAALLDINLNSQSAARARH